MLTATETSASTEATQEHGQQAGELSSPAPGDQKPLPLWRNLQFQTLWLGQSASTLGVAVADIAYPLAILAITGSPARAGLFAAVQATGMLVAGLPAGSLADRYDSRKIAIGAEACRALITCVVVIALVRGWPSLALLLSAAALLGAGQAISGAARMLLVRAVVPASQLTRALTQDEIRMNGSALVGPALGGALYGVHALAHAVPFLFTAGCFVLAVTTATVMKLLPGGAAPVAPVADRPVGQSTAGPDKPADRTVRDNDMLAGLRTLWREPVLRAAMLLIMAVNTVGAGLDLAIIVLLRHQHIPSGTIGLALGIGAVGGLAGAPLVKALHRINPGVLLFLVSFELVLIFALLALPFGPWWTAGLVFVSMLGVPAIRVLVDILVLRQAPTEVRGRVVAAVMMLVGLGIPVGTGAVGLLLQYLPAEMAVLTLAAVLAVVVGFCCTNRTLWRARWPQ